MRCVLVHTDNWDPSTHALLAVRHLIAAFRWATLDYITYPVDLLLCSAQHVSGLLHRAAPGAPVFACHLPESKASLPLCLCDVCRLQPAPASLFPRCLGGIGGDDDISDPLDGTDSAGTAPKGGGCQLSVGLCQCFFTAVSLCISLLCSQLRTLLIMK